MRALGVNPGAITPAAAHSHPDCRGIPILIVALHFWEGNHLPAIGPNFFRSRRPRLNVWRDSTSDPEISQSFLNMAKAYRSQADLLKVAKKKADKKHR
jgi:hypothetical protein